MDHFVKIYSHHADTYHRMIAAEEVEANLPQAIEAVSGLRGKRILDVGSGTGRIPLLLHNKAAQIIGLDLHAAMLREQQNQRQQMNGNWALLRGDLRGLPFSPKVFDLVTAGWAIGHFTGWFAADWHTEVDRALREMLRVVKPGGALIIIETLTTGSLTPAPPSTGLAAYYSRLENHWGFSRQEIRTDYQFRDLAEAVALTGFFFGEALAQKVRQNNWVRLPEWTGVWGKRVTSEAGNK